MSNPYFDFKQFTVWHDQCAMRVNTDGVLLGAWVTVNKPDIILDIGTGTGLIALMMAQRSNALVYGIEIEESAYKQAVSNVENSPWATRIHILKQDFCHYYKDISTKYDLIVSNPPYFKDSLKNSQQIKSLARHNDSLPSEILIKGVTSILSDKGIFAVILPQNTSEFEQEAFISGLKCTRRTIVRSLPEKGIMRQMLEFKKNSQNLPEVKSELSIYSVPGQYSDKYIQFTRDFYLKL